LKRALITGAGAGCAAERPNSPQLVETWLRSIGMMAWYALEVARDSHIAQRPRADVASVDSG